jgi:hypothetical protein
LKVIDSGGAAETTAAGKVSASIMYRAGTSARDELSKKRQQPYACNVRMVTIGNARRAARIWGAYDLRRCLK